LVLLSRARADDAEHLVVHFEATHAMELLTSYRMLVVDVVDEDRRRELIEWTGVPPRLPG
jgi:hypothetical protein